MFSSYIKTAFRNLWRNKTLSVINLLGLSIALSVCLLIVLFAKDELSYDRFHEHRDEIYQLTCKIISRDGKTSNYGLGGVPEGPAFAASIPEIRSFVRVSNGEVVIKKGADVFEEKVLWADSNFFSMFTFPLLAGNPATALNSPHSIVLSSDMAIKYFGTADALGKIIELETNNKSGAFVVTGIAKPTPENSSIRFKLLLPFSNSLRSKFSGWFLLSFPTFFLMPAHTDLTAVAKKMGQIYQVKSGIAEERKKWGMEEQFVWGLQPLVDMHLNTAVTDSPQASDPIYSYMLGAIALFILLIACINFINLTIASSLHRSKEIGIRKVVGAERKQLIVQFLSESFFVCFIAFLLALILTELTLPLFNSLANKQLSLSYLMDLSLAAGFFLLFLLAALASGFYPAIVLSKFDPVHTLYRHFKFTGRNYLSKSLIVLQFTLATFLVTGTFFIYRQLNYFTHKDLGYNPTDLISISTGMEHDRALMEVFKNEFSKLAGVRSVSPRMGGDWFTLSRANGKNIEVKYEHVDENYFATLQIPLLYGRNFSSDFPADSTNSVIINESYAKAAGWKGSPIGKTVDGLNGQNDNLTVVGMVRDYHFESLKDAIKPQIFSTNPDLPFGRFILRVAPKKALSVLKSAEAVYHRLRPYHPFVYTFVSETNQKLYEEENRWKDIITFAAAFAVFISCIGLFGLTLLAVQKRRKEIGVRKVLGASVAQISTLVSRHFIGLVLLAFLLAVPFTWYAVNKWLQGFAYHIELQWYVFGAALLVVVFVALTTVGFNAIKAAVSNPVKNLRSE